MSRGKRNREWVALRWRGLGGSGTHQDTAPTHLPGTHGKQLLTLTPTGLGLYVPPTQDNTDVGKQLTCPTGGGEADSGCVPGAKWSTGGGGRLTWAGKGDATDPV